MKVYGKAPSDIESLLDAVCIYSQVIATEFGLDKCTMLSIKWEKNNMKESKCPKRLDEDDHYQYLGILQADHIKPIKVQEKVRSEYLKKVKIVKSKVTIVCTQQ